MRGEEGPLGSKRESACSKEEVEEPEFVDLAKSILTLLRPLSVSFYALSGEFHMTMLSPLPDFIPGPSQCEQQKVLRGPSQQPRWQRRHGLVEVECGISPGPALAQQLESGW